jgi:Trk K+ transport system NAD-binding subunit
MFTGPPDAWYSGLNGENEIIPKDNHFIYPGDHLIVLADKNKAADVQAGLIDIAGAAEPS